MTNHGKEIYLIFGIVALMFIAIIVLIVIYNQPVSEPLRKTPHINATEIFNNLIKSIEQFEPNVMEIGLAILGLLILLFSGCYLLSEKEI